MKRNLILSVFDQAVVSAFNFALNLFLIKLWSPEHFGFFAVIAATAISANMIQNAVINTPLAVHLPIINLASERAVLVKVFSAANMLLTLVVLLLSLTFLMLWLGVGQLPLVLGASLYMGTQFLREYYRALLAVDGKLGALLLADLAYVMLAVGSLAYVFWLGDASKQSVALVLLLLSAAGMSSVVWCLVPRKWPDLRALPSEMVDVFKKQMHEIRWSLLGVITTDIQNRGYIFVAAAFFGSATVGHLQAGRIFFGPLNLLTSSWARVARPQLAKLLGQGEAQRFDTTLKRAMWAFAGFNVLFLAGLWLAWPYLSALVFGAKYKGLGYMIAAWGVANMAFQIRSCLSIGVQAMRRFRDLTLATIWGALLSVVLVALACGVQQPMVLIAAVIGGECVAILIVLKIMRRHANADTKTVT